MTREKFEEMIEKEFQRARDLDFLFVTINAGDIHRKVGGFPGSDNRMPTCCNVMRKRMKDGDTIIDSPPKGNGASLTIKYKL